MGLGVAAAYRATHGRLVCDSIVLGKRIESCGVRLPNEHGQCARRAAFAWQLDFLWLGQRKRKTCPRLSCCWTMRSCRMEENATGEQGSCRPRFKELGLKTATRQFLTCSRAYRQRDNFKSQALLQQLNQHHARARSTQDELEARINAFELAFRMQAEAPEARRSTDRIGGDPSPVRSGSKGDASDGSRLSFGAASGGARCPVRTDLLRFRKQVGLALGNRAES